MLSISPFKATGGVNGPVAVLWVSFGSDSSVLPRMGSSGTRWGKALQARGVVCHSSPKVQSPMAGQVDFRGRFAHHVANPARTFTWSPNFAAPPGSDQLWGAGSGLRAGDKGTERCRHKRLREPR